MQQEPMREQTDQDRRKGQIECIDPDDGQTAEPEKGRLQQQADQDRGKGGPAEQQPHESGQHQMGARRADRHMDERGDKEDGRQESGARDGLGIERAQTPSDARHREHGCADQDRRTENTVDDVHSCNRCPDQGQDA